MHLETIVFRTPSDHPYRYLSHPSPHFDKYMVFALKPENIVSLTFTLGRKNEKQPSGPTELR